MLNEKSLLCEEQKSSYFIIYGEEIPSQNLQLSYVYRQMG